VGLALDVSTDDEGGVLGAVHLGTEPNRFDLLTSLRGVANQSVFEAVQQIDLEGIAVKIISLQHLVEATRNSDRAHDRADVEELLKINQER
jgi:predicted nucleotidyltransferase